MIRSQFVYVGGFAERKSGVRRIIESHKTHPDFDQSKLRNDVCLVLLKKKLPYGPNVQPICLPDASFELVDDEKIYLAGWGSKSVSGALENTLRSAQLNVTPFGKCSAAYGKDGMELASEGQFCGSTNDGGVGPCRGDWGAPAVVQRKTVLIICLKREI